MRKLSILVLAGSLLQSATPLALVATAQEMPQPAVSATQASLTNRDILEMSKSGLSADIIVAKIKASPGAKFDTSPVALQELKAANIPESVILAMLGSEMPALAAVPRAPGSHRRGSLHERLPGGLSHPWRQRVGHLRGRQVPATIRPAAARAKSHRRAR